MVKHPLFAIIFQLEYVVNVPVSQPELPTNKKTRTKVVFFVDWRNMFKASDKNTRNIACFIQLLK